jgi:hypothetical protein
VTKYHVEFDFETNIPRDNLRQFSVSIPKDAVIEEVVPTIPEGWYQEIHHFVQDLPPEVAFWPATEIERYGAGFLDTFSRMEEPKPYGSTSLSGRIGTTITEAEFNTLPDGCAIVDRDGDRWTRLDGEWSHSTYDWTLPFEDYKPYTLVSVGK